MAHDDDNAILCAGKFRDDIADGKLSFDGVGGKGIIFDLIGSQVVVFQMIEDVALEFLVVLVAHVALAKGGDFAGVLEGALGVNVREWGVVGGRGCRGSGFGRRRRCG